ncbi:LOW QUALITY PROTEIN: Reverse transcriptase precursor [Phytophthora megakarya]|uniref:Reverse transcriptase n=1 Tax=Phytophthora megakarya TaxID=4795 RepID=A0A225V080_9STRA|nr:LOW QUALITY PROTEIN: Reverse transcriptase precursor [Phytophthora megakarya]
MALHLRSPTNPLRVKKPERIYPVPTYAKGSVDAYTLGTLDALHDRLCEDQPSPEEAVQLWDVTKQRLVKGLRRCKRQARRRQKHVYRQKLTRLLRQYRAAMNAELGQQDAMDDLTALFDGITLDDTESTTGSTRMGKIRRAIAELQQERGQNNLKTRIRANTWNEGRTTKQLFRSTSSKFTDNVVPTLISDNGFPCHEIHDKANTFADAWHPIFNQTNAAKLDIDDALRWTTENHSSNESLQALTADITVEEVQQAIEACGAGKACGPDTLNNDWYRDFKESFQLPFLEADIFCLKKAGDASNPLNYRPLALLNSDYKIFTRIFATRVSRSLATRIHEHQNGFVPGRQIHDTIDLFTAAQVVANADQEQHEAVALLLDFQKAYDSLNREYLHYEHMGILNNLYRQ